MASIQRVLNQRSIDHWQMLLDGVPLNRFERASVRMAMDGFRELLLRRDEVDRVRSRIPTRQEVGQTYYALKTGDQRDLFRALRAFFDEYYSTLSKLSGLVARFSRVFGKNFSDNGPFLAWTKLRYDLPEGTQDELERGRLFRAILAHPQQFPPYEWATAATVDFEIVHVVLHGPLGRGRNPVPAGAVTDHVLAEHLSEWQFDSPDEVSVTNALSNLAVHLFAEILEHRTQMSSFVQSRTRDELLARLSPDAADVGWDARYQRSLFDDDHLPPASAVSPWSDGGSQARGRS